ncbi:MAG: glycoside hydrolase family 2 [Bacteroidales bacterium]|nr:glycoside hydrolase family 2 [Bacteroidales bacterium]
MKRLIPVLCTLGILLAGACTSPEKTCEIPLPEHPRPDFERAEWINLNGYWSFTFDADAAGKALAGKTCAPLESRILVPFPWGSKLSEAEDKGDVAWYGREITVPQAWEGKRVFLVVGASDWETTAWLDGEAAGSHQGGYTPFECELKNVRFGEKQQLLIKADDTSSDAHLYGKQGYGNARGIWQTVYLEARGSNYIQSLHFTPDIDAAKVRVDAVLSQSAAEGECITLTFKDGSQPKAVLDPKGGCCASAEIALKDQHLWDLDDPYLYEVSAALEGKDGTIDAVDSYFGQRKISVTTLPGTDYPYVALNNNPLYLQLCLDQSYHPEGFYTFPSDAFMKREIEISKQLGLNGNRIHIKVEVPRKLYWADKLGLLIMADTPNFWGKPVPEAREDWERCLRAQVERDYNHPSIFAWVNFNETWGLKGEGGVYEKETQEWVRDMYHLTKRLDPTRLVEDNSACNFDHVESDINSWHAYKRGRLWEATVAEASEKTFPGSTWNYIGGNTQNGVPMMNSECGNVWGYDGSAGDCDYTWDYHIMINAFRRHPKCCGWLYTEHHDVINEWNGYVKYDRSEKIDGLGELLPGMTIADFQSAYYIQPDCYLYTERAAGSELDLPLLASFMTDKDPGQLSVETQLVGWDALGSYKTFEEASVPIEFGAYACREAGRVHVRMPDQNGLYLLRMVLKNGRGEILHRNFTTFRVKDGKTPAGEKTALVSFEPASFTAQEWSDKQTLVYDGLKVNGFGHGYFEYAVTLPETEGLGEAELVFEASAKQWFGKDREGNEIQGDYMLGHGTFDPCKSPNSYAMTDKVLWPSKLEVSVDGKVIGKHDLSDDPADHRGILSWGSQTRERWMREAGSYGELVRMNVPASLLKGKKQVVIRFTTPADDLDGGLALYGKDFGRYPLDPTLVLKF